MDFMDLMITVEKQRTLTTFCLSNSNLSHLSRVTSCLRPSTRESPFCVSQHMLHGLPLGVSADDMLSRPVSLSTAPPAMPRPSSSTLFSDDESLSDIATRLAPLRVREKKKSILTTRQIKRIAAFSRGMGGLVLTWKSCVPDGCPDWIWAMTVNSFCCPWTTIYQTTSDEDQIRSTNIKVVKNKIRSHDESCNMKYENIKNKMSLN